MKSILISTYLLGIFLELYAAPQTAILPNVINGTEITSPHAVLVFVTQQGSTQTGALGGGSIISQRHILTSASLVYGGFNISIGYGSSTTETLKQTSSTTFVWHSAFNRTSADNDIALIFLSVANQIDLTVAAVITLPSAAPAVGTNGAAAGFGFTGPDQSAASTILNLALLQVLPLVNCTEQFNLTLDTQFCVGSQGESNICPGDNGVGLYTTSGGDSTSNEKPTSSHILNPRDAIDTLIGIASLIGNSWNCEINQVRGFTDVSKYLDWIETFTGISPPTTSP